MNTKPLASVVIACRNEARYITACVRSIIEQDLDESIEVIVADGGSTDGTRDLLNKLEQWSTPKRSVLVIHNDLRHAGAGFAAASNRATGKYLMLCGARTELRPGHIRDAIYLLEQQRGRGVRVVGGGVSEFRPRSDKLLDRAVSLLYASPAGAGAAAYHRLHAEADVDTVYCGLYDRLVFNEVGGIDASYARGQDSELNARVLRAGYKIRFSPALSCPYSFTIGLKGTLNRGISTGKNVSAGWLRDAHSFRLRHLAPIALVAYLAATATMALVAPGLALLASPLMVAYLLTVVALAAAASYRYSLILTPATALVFVSYHLSYGVGQIVGLANPR